MEKWNLVLGILASATTVFTGVAVFALWVVRSQVKDLKADFDVKFAQLGADVKTLQHDVSELRKSVEQIDERQRRHTSDTGKHVTAEWKGDLQNRMRSLETLALKIAAKLGVDS